MSTRYSDSMGAPGKVLSRRGFMRLSGAAALGSLPFWNTFGLWAAEASGTTVSQAPLPNVDARFPCRIANGIWIIPDKRIFLVPNIGIVEGSHSVLVVDCGLGLQSGPNVFRERIRNEYPAWEHTEFIDPAIRYFSEHAAG